MAFQPVYFIRSNQQVKAPTKATEESAGYDLYSSETKTISPHSQDTLETGLTLILPKNSVGFIKDRSGIVLNKKICIHGGVIDCDFRGPLKIILYNFGSEDCVIQKNTRIAQLVILPLISTLLKEKFSLEDTSPTKRGSNGFGSSGIL